jgi:hypothetical protein
VGFLKKKIHGKDRGKANIKKRGTGIRLCVLSIFGKDLVVEQKRVVWLSPKSAVIVAIGERWKLVI